MALSAVIMLVTVGSAPLVAWFYNEPRLIWITAGYAISILFTGLYIQHEAILSRADALCCVGPDRDRCDLDWSDRCDRRRPGAVLLTGRWCLTTRDDIGDGCRSLDRL
jgi:hypothetical protein